MTLSSIIHFSESNNYIFKQATTIEVENLSKTKEKKNKCDVSVFFFNILFCK
jgi:hypothetical protein